MGFCFLMRAFGFTSVALKVLCLFGGKAHWALGKGVAARGGLRKGVQALRRRTASGYTSPAAR